MVGFALCNTCRYAPGDYRRRGAVPHQNRNIAIVVIHCPRKVLWIDDQNEVWERICIH